MDYFLRAKKKLMISETHDEFVLIRKFVVFCCLHSDRCMHSQKYQLPHDNIRRRDTYETHIFCGQELFVIQGKIKCAFEYVDNVIRCLVVELLCEYILPNNQHTHPVVFYKQSDSSVCDTGKYQ